MTKNFNLNPAENSQPADNEQKKKPKVYVDGQSGTTGLQIVQRLQKRDDVELLLLEDDKRRDVKARKAMMDQADLVFLCLPDATALEAEKMIKPNTIVIDASSAHRCSWEYGFAQLDDQRRERLSHATRIANPGCHASGVIALMYPLVKSGKLNPMVPISAFSVTGYSGGGRKMIAEFDERHESGENGMTEAYSLSMMHKHIPEIKHVTGMKHVAMLPVIGDFAQGMMISIVLDTLQFNTKETAESLRQFYYDWYQPNSQNDSAGVTVSLEEDGGRLNAVGYAGRDDMEIHVNGLPEAGSVLLQAFYDNLGKGACAAAIENMEIALNLERKK